MNKINDQQQAGKVPTFEAAVNALHLLANYLGDPPLDLNLDHEISLRDARDAIAYALSAKPSPGEGVRAQFEAWAKSAGLETKIYDHNDMYSHPVTRGAWMAWQQLAARQPVGQEPVLWGVRVGDSDCWGYVDVESDADFIGRKSGLNYEKRPFYAAPPAQGIDLGHAKFRDPDHLAEWLGSLVDGNEQEEWDAAQAAMQGVRAYQRDADTVLRLQAAVEGECDGLAITPEQAAAIFDYVLQPLNYDSQRDAAPGVGS